MSQSILNHIINLDNASHYRFIYDDLSYIIREKKSVGNTKVRFVSKALRFRNDVKYRHVSLEFTDTDMKNTHVSETYSNFTVHPNEWKDEFCITLPNVELSMEDISKAEQKLSSMYLLGVHDCRHHVSDMLKLCYSIEKS